MKGKHSSSTSPAPGRGVQTQISTSHSTPLICLNTDSIIHTFADNMVCLFNSTVGAGADTVSSHRLVQPCALVLISGVSLPRLSPSDGGDCDLYVANCADFPN